MVAFLEGYAVISDEERCCVVLRKETVVVKKRVLVVSFLIVAISILSLLQSEGWPSFGETGQAGDSINFGDAVVDQTATARYTFKVLATSQTSVQVTFYDPCFSGVRALFLGFSCDTDSMARPLRYRRGRLATPLNGLPSCGQLLSLPPVVGRMRELAIRVPWSSFRTLGLAQLIDLDVFGVRSWYSGFHLLDCSHGATTENRI